HHAGLAILRRRSEQKDQWFASLRIPPAIYRPIQIDAMHADIWVNGCNIAIDPGTYRYNASGAWATIPLALGRSHNVIVSGDQDLAKRAGRFLYVPWPRVVVDDVAAVLPSDDSSFQCEFGRPIGRIKRWNRKFAFTENGAEVTDRLECQPDCPISVRWQLVDGEIVSDSFPSNPEATDTAVFVWRTPVGTVEASFQSDLSSISIEHTRGGGASRDPAAGWYAPRYGELAPCHSLNVQTSNGSATQLTITSRFRLIEPPAVCDSSKSVKEAT
ncbi:MAG: heparinase II/III family protein, partial [Rubripirellula sp.]